MQMHLGWELIWNHVTWWCVNFASIVSPMVKWWWSGERRWLISWSLLPPRSVQESYSPPWISLFWFLRCCHWMGIDISFNLCCDQMQSIKVLLVRAVPSGHITTPLSRCIDCVEFRASRLESPRLVPRLEESIMSQILCNLPRTFSETKSSFQQSSTQLADAMIWDFIDCILWSIPTTSMRYYRREASFSKACGSLFRGALGPVSEPGTTSTLGFASWGWCSDWSQCSISLFLLHHFESYPMWDRWIFGRR